jgi:heat shock protein HslJ
MAVSSSILDDDSGITFLSDGKVSIQTACNSGVGVFSLKDELFSLKDLIFNEMACQKERMIREEEFIQSLQKVNSYSILRKTLFLKRDGIVYLTFQQVK